MPVRGDFCDIIGAPCPFNGLYFDCWDCYSRQELADDYDELSSDESLFTSARPAV